MPIPKRNLRVQVITLTMMELRSQPGEVLDAARDGAVIKITRNGKHVATLTGAKFDSEAPTIIYPDGSFDGPAPLTKGRPELLAKAEDHPHGR